MQYIGEDWSPSPSSLGTYTSCYGNSSSMSPLNQLHTLLMYHVCLETVYNHGQVAASWGESVKCEGFSMHLLSQQCGKF